MSLLPPNASTQEVSMEETVSRISDIPTPLRDLWNADTCPASLLPWLAWTFAVGEWSTDWTDSQKRALIKSSVETHLKKGTVGAVRRIVDSFGAGFALKEWWQTSHLLPANLFGPHPACRAGFDHFRHHEGQACSQPL